MMTANPIKKSIILKTSPVLGRYIRRFFSGDDVLESGFVGARHERIDKLVSTRLPSFKVL